MGRQRHCGYCYGRGHNRSTCEELTKRLKEYAEDEVKVNKIDAKNGVEPLLHYQRYQKEYAKRIKSTTLLDGTKLDLPIRSRRKSTRTCSYCGEAGHNRRGCVAFAERKESIIKATSDYRKAIKKQLEDTGWGIGALVSGINRDGEVEDVYLVTEINFETPSYLTMFQESETRERFCSIKLTNINPEPRYYWTKSRSINLPPLEVSRVPDSVKAICGEYAMNKLTTLHEQFNKYYELSSGVETGISFPRGWTGKVASSKAAGMEEHFKNIEDNKAWDNRYNAKKNDW